MGKLTDTMPWTVALESRATRRKIFGLLLIVLLMLSTMGTVKHRQQAYEEPY